MDMQTWKAQVFNPWLQELEQESLEYKTRLASLKEHKNTLVRVVTLLLDGKNTEAVGLWNSIKALPALEQATYLVQEKEFVLKFKDQKPQVVLQSVLFAELNAL